MPRFPVAIARGYDRGVESPGQPPSSVVLRQMGTDDIDAVMAVERAAFSSNWPATAFQRELTQNAMARYLVLEVDGQIAGFGGLWLMLDEAHIVTVAVEPSFRRKGLGRFIVHGLVQLAECEGMEAATLEVRVSNVAARALYGRYGFYEVGLRKKYYADNQEDAVIMTTEALASDAYRRRFQRLAEELEALLPGSRPRVEGCCIGGDG